MRHTCFHEKQLHNLSFLDVPTLEKFMNNQQHLTFATVHILQTLHCDEQRQWLG